jgi:AcrR family transcriptional regulator
MSAVALAGRPRSHAIDDAIVAAARELLDEVGYRSLTMEAVAVRAGIGKQSLYRRWPRKPLLIFAAVLGGQETVAEQIPDTGSFATDLAAITAEQLSVYEAPGMTALVQGLLADCLTEPELIAELRRRFVRPRLAMLEQVADRARQRGEVDADVSSRAIADTLAGAMFARFIVFGDGDAAFAAELARIVEKGAR